MKRKTNVLYVWGYGGSPLSHTVKHLKKYLGKDFNVYSEFYAQYDPVNAIIDINYYIEKYKIDLVIGSSLGAFLTLQLPNNVQKVMINPCLYPNIELPLLKNEQGEQDVPQHIVDFYATYINEHNIWEYDNDSNIFIMGDEDELLGLKYVSEINSHKGTVHIVKQGHHNTEESVRDFVVPIINKLYNKE